MFARLIFTIMCVVSLVSAPALGQDGIADEDHRDSLDRVREDLSREQRRTRTVSVATGVGAILVGTALVVAANQEVGFHLDVRENRLAGADALMIEASERRADRWKVVRLLGIGSIALGSVTILSLSW